MRPDGRYQCRRCKRWIPAQLIGPHLSGAPCMRAVSAAYDRERARERALLDEAQRQVDRAQARMLGDIDEEKR